MRSQRQAAKPRDRYRTCGLATVHEDSPLHMLDFPTTLAKRMDAVEQAGDAAKGRTPCARKLRKPCDSSPDPLSRSNRKGTIRNARPHNSACPFP